MDIIEMLEKLVDSPDFVEEVLATLPEARIESYAEDNYIFKQNEETRGELYIILEGLVEVVITDEFGINKVLGYRYPLDFLGEDIFSQEGLYSHSALVVEECECLLLPRKSLRELIDRQAEFAEYLIESLVDWKHSCCQHLIEEEKYRQQRGDGLELHPFRKKLFEIMSSPVETCVKTAPVAEIARAMKERQVSSIVVEEDNRPIGIVTERELVHKIMTQKKVEHEFRAQDVMSTNIITMPREAFYYQALYSMVKHKIKHIIVLKQDLIEGIVTIRDLTETRNAGLVTIVNEIETQNSIQELNEARQRVDKVLKALIVENASAREICELITEFNDRLTRRIIELSEEEMKREGYGAPPVEYCFLQMGSAGRKEQFLRTDQDNGFIWVNEGQPKEKVEEYFRVFGEKIVDKLIKCGFEECDGGVMVSNHYWRNSLEEWRQIMQEWLADLNFTKVRSFNIFFDHRPIYGNFNIARLLKHHLVNLSQRNDTVLYFLGKVALYNQLPLGLFGRLLTKNSEEHEDEINLKLGGSIQMVDCVRAFSLKEGIHATSTFERLEVLVEKNVISENNKENLSQAYQKLLEFRIKENLKKIEAGKEADNYINPQKLDKNDYQDLKEALKQVKQLMKLTAHTFKV
ncbi:DUF294 nucleotidyltransferase-like domain-containing protein [Fuchsiella alkaliacetigena]|uniref:DUF294 nucleotidyltransferase-like domain-containing protein n=1 Tax=Fuchsiella alkaliacetigena TaxID=957042 RepID=UPI00200B4D10|nr:DUF294 nucleotidyltransferase-like domain-containing protein [Fuchsiella alkaliacetigena]MCK8825735.1 DUF294 nucleotidyltransferase-like domain-containing protein [Fuchsiella alkaliacetigena]